MTAQALGTLVLAGGAIGVLVWLVNKIGRALTAVLEALATVTMVLVAVWLLVKTVYVAVKAAVTHWRTTLGGALLTLCLWWWGWIPVVGAIVAVAGILAVWRWRHRLSFETRVGRWLRSWWQRWAVYARKLPGWLRACGLTVSDADRPIVVTANPLGRNKVRRQPKQRADQVPRVLRVRSGASWDEVRVRLVPGQKPEDFDDAARALAVARGVARCQVRELSPNVVSIDFQRRNLLADTVDCLDLADLTAMPGTDVDLAKVWSGRTDYGVDWHQSLTGSHTLHAGVTGAGKGAQMWCPLVSIAPAIRDGLVRVSGIDPKGMELAYGRRIFHRYAVTGKDALALLDDLIGVMDRRKAEFAGRLRSVPISREHPLEIVEFDEIGALIRYIGDRKLREAITERVALLTTQGRALGCTVRGYVQEPTKDTVPVRELFPRRICLRVATKSHVGMVLGDQAYERGAWANRIGENEPGVGYLFGEGIREPLRIRGGWVPDETIKDLEAFVTGTTPPSRPGTIHTFPNVRSARDNAPGGAA
ncbi:FtsK/SpoIIIE domain-containing protein [Actinophytocola algeriensis]|uniref:S-DNA-T family DNA segregation ATPase FtsK/SpoIIIE n=1 Tax=Actinophytocola algeriensis TaxID=1768010 RepID=A0A7W7VBF8_9PSEU|nr:FtsK/SpoIIIE domain-containing protein [Actinophytocola algeriensis]MBB4903990.1 S-DNA-T family DNA segregation ATPase FtsK/SpoIIIE [Actinophytocola algeriensis]MBE1477153.1 S-DNA-T family DNA segregation ATPase FtsK/SpoIIIE [Actinophytocola algeriensis]